MGHGASFAMASPSRRSPGSATKRRSSHTAPVVVGGWQSLHHRTVAATPNGTPNTSTPNGIRTRVTALKGQRPGPLDDGGLDGTEWVAGRRRYQRTVAVLRKAG